MRGKWSMALGGVLLLGLLAPRLAPYVDVHYRDVPLPSQKAEVVRISSKLDAAERKHFKVYMQAYEMQLLIDAQRAWSTMGMRTVRQAIEIGRQASGPMQSSSDAASE